MGQNYMFEKIYAYVLLLQANIVTIEEYNNYLNALFLEDSKNELLLELELVSNDLSDTLTIINDAFYKRKALLNSDVFGSVLFEKIKRLYEKNTLKIEDFGCKANFIWNLIPGEICRTEPFWTLCYADDCLSYGDEAQARRLYERAFSYEWKIIVIYN